MLVYSRKVNNTHTHSNQLTYNSFHGMKHTWEQSGLWHCGMPQTGCLVYRGQRSDGFAEVRVGQQIRVSHSPSNLYNNRSVHILSDERCQYYDSTYVRLLNHFFFTSWPLNLPCAHMGNFLSLSLCLLWTWFSRDNHLASMVSVSFSGVDKTHQMLLCQFLIISLPFCSFYLITKTCMPNKVIRNIYNTLTW